MAEPRRVAHQFNGLLLIGSLLRDRKGKRSLVRWLSLHLGLALGTYYGSQTLRIRNTVSVSNITSRADANKLEPPQRIILPSDRTEKLAQSTKRAIRLMMTAVTHMHLKYGCLVCVSVFE